VLVPAVAAAVALTHWPALSSTAQLPDDDQQVFNNPLVQYPSWTSLRQLFGEVTRPSTGGYYKPLSMASLMLDRAIAGRADNLLPFRVTSLTLHIVNVALVILILYQLFGSPWPAVLAGLMFGVHPITVESIPWAAERKNLLAACGAFSTIALYIYYTRHRSRLAYAGAIAAYALALLSKPTALPTPVLLLLLDAWPLRRFIHRGGTQTRREEKAGDSDADEPADAAAAPPGPEKCITQPASLSSPCLRASAVILLEKVPFFVLAIASAIVTFISQSRAAVAVLPTAQSWLRPLWIVCYDMVFYPFKLVWPARLSIFYPLPEPLDWSVPFARVGLIGTLLLIAILLFSARRTRALWVGWLAFVIAILPTLGVIGFTDVIAADRFAYFPLLGLLLPLAALLTQFWQPGSNDRWRPIRRTATLVAILLLASAEAVATRGYLRYWRDSEALARRTVQLAPRAFKAHNSLGLALLEQNRYAEAARSFERAIELRPDFALAHNSLGLALYNLGLRDDALEQFRLALHFQPDNARAHLNYANALFELRRLDEARTHYEQALAFAPGDYRVQFNFGTFCLATRRLHDAIEHLERALRYRPDVPNGHRYLADALLQAGRPEDALRHYRAELELFPDNLVARLALEQLLLQRGQRNVGGGSQP